MDEEDNLLKYRENALNYIESDLSFKNRQLLGKIIDKNGNYSLFNGSRFMSNYRLHKANKLTKQIGSLLDLEDHIISAAQNQYKLVQSKNWIQGRSTSLVVLACLYITCRRNETGHLMIDFANVMHIDIYALSKIYLKLCRFMNYVIKLNDPSLYVPRFMKSLHFPKEKEKKILEYVLRLLSRMREDWLGVGRRPTGLIAAGFFIASKCFNINKSIKDISQVLKVSEETIRKRVNEFKNLKVAKLTQEEFLKLPYSNKIIEPEDPPAYKRKRLLSIQQKKELKMLEQKKKETERRISTDLVVLENDVKKNKILNKGEIVLYDKDNKNKKLDHLNNEEIKADEFPEEEIEACLLKPYEVKIKTIAWYNNNKDWILEQEEKEKHKNLEKVNFKEKRKMERNRKINKKNKVKKQIFSNSNNLLVKKIIENSKIGSSINTSALEKLFEDAKNSKNKLESSL